MSGRSYSLDFRAKVIDLMKEGASCRNVADMFKIDKNTVSAWWLRYKQEGHCNPKKNVGAKPKIDQEDFMKFALENPNLKSECIGKSFGLSRSGAWKCLKRLGFVFKKNPSLMQKPISKNKNYTWKKSEA